MDKKGRRTFIIRVQREGKRPKISTGAHDEKTALEEYERWIHDPDGYRPRALGPTGSPGKKPVDLTCELVDEFLAWSAKKGHHGNGNSVGHIANQRIAMDFWIFVTSTAARWISSSINTVEKARALSARRPLDDAHDMTPSRRLSAKRLAVSVPVGSREAGTRDDPGDIQGPCRNGATADAGMISVACDQTISSALIR
ncbi:MAG: hypothetical protein ACT4TC_01415 [Myxococcaceae bacterium]